MMVLAGDPWRIALARDAGRSSCTRYCWRGYVCQGDRLGIFALAGAQRYQLTAGGVWPRLSTHVISSSASVSISAAAAPLSRRKRCWAFAFIGAAKHGLLPTPQVNNTPSATGFLISMNFRRRRRHHGPDGPGSTTRDRRGASGSVVRREAERKLELHQAVLEETVRDRTADSER
jgi:hypothetical protein